MASKKTNVSEAEQPQEQEVVVCDTSNLETEIFNLKKSLQEAIVERDRRVQEVFDRDKEIQKLKSEHEKQIQRLIGEQETSLKNLQEQITVKNNQITSNFDAVAKAKTVTVELESKNKQLEILTNKFNELAKLFDEHLKGFDDILELEKLMVRNSLRAQELLQIKIKAFNGEGENKK
ncbi:MAG: hypothetical protein ACO3BB_00115 [Bacilli bacterium]